ncbi:MAG: helix-turn-helix domain-containing protein [Oscillospiraceae bacterium]|nr:helix-turn-helix domain-containing protein [Oscillospiraceae bacterium]
MPDEAAILPSASTRFIFSVTDNCIHSGLCGVNTRAFNAGSYANKMKLMLFVEFHIGMLFPFLKVEQHELADSNFSLTDLDKTLAQQIEAVLLESESIEVLISTLDKIFLSRMSDFRSQKIIAAMRDKILKYNGNVTQKKITSEFYYSEKHIRRLFLQYIGTSPKMFSRIVRINHVIHLMKSPARFTDIALQAGFFDQPHLNHDFKIICGITPMEYMRNMSVFYNDEFKI